MVRSAYTVMMQHLFDTYDRFGRQRIAVLNGSVGGDGMDLHHTRLRLSLQRVINPPRHLSYQRLLFRHIPMGTASIVSPTRREG